MPELPDIELYLSAFQRMFSGQVLSEVNVRSPFVVRSVELAPADCVGQTLRGFHRLGKRIVWEFTGDLFLIFHLMIAGRFHLKKGTARSPGKFVLASFHFGSHTLLFTEASTKKRASIHAVKGKAAMLAFRPAGLEVLTCSLPEFQARLRSENHTLKRALTDPRLIAGIGNAYSDEILHAAKLSPLKWTSRLNDDEIERLFQTTQRVLKDWTARLQDQTGAEFPEKVTAFRPEMSVHGQYKRPCPVCGHPVQRIVYSENETNYCASCQTEGKILADRSLSRLLKDDWPRSLVELDEHKM